MNRPDAGVVFDLDGVITDTAEYHYTAWKSLADRLGVPFDRQLNERLKGVSRMESLEIILESSDRVFTDEQKTKLAAEKNTAYVALIETITPENLLPGAQEILELLKREGYRIGLASASKNALPVIKSLQVAEYFDYIVNAATIKNSKPDPEIFFAAVSGLGLTPEVCIGVEDAIAGIKAIKAAGMFAVGVGKPDILCQADVVIKNLREFKIEDYLQYVR